MKYVTYAAAVETLKGFFKDHPDSDIVSLHEIYIASNRDLNQPELNKSWVGNKLTHLKHYQLVTPIYTHGRRKVLDKVQLTSEGKKALGRAGNSSTYAASDEVRREVTLESIANDIREFEKKNPSVVLELSVKVRKDVVVEAEQFAA